MHIDLYFLPHYFYLMNYICLCSCLDGVVVDNDSDDDDVCDADEVVGCQDNTACNYYEDATDAGD